MSSVPESKISDGRALAAAWLIVLGAFLLPIRDTLKSHSILSAAAGIGFASAGTDFPVGILGWGAGAVIGLIVIMRSVDRGSALRHVLTLAALWTAGYAYVTAVDVAITRSSAVDHWNLCDDPYHSPGGFDADVSDYRREPSFEGPHLGNGDPCVLSSEHRDEHLREYPRGNATDGLLQILKRFSDDRQRVFGGTAVAFVLVGFGLLLLLVRRGPGIVPAHALPAGEANAREAAVE